MVKLKAKSKSRMESLCKYRDMFGAPGTGVHAWRFMGLAVVDVGATLIAAWLIAYFNHIAFWKVAVALFLMGIVMHHLFCVRTTIDRLLFVA